MTNFSRSDLVGKMAGQPLSEHDLSAADLVLAANAAELKAANYAESGDARNARLHREISRTRRRTAEFLKRLKPTRPNNL